MNILFSVTIAVALLLIYAYGVYNVQFNSEDNDIRPDKTLEEIIEAGKTREGFNTLTWNEFWTFQHYYLNVCAQNKELIKKIEALESKGKSRRNELFRQKRFA